MNMNFKSYGCIYKLCFQAMPVFSKQRMVATAAANSVAANS